MKRFHLIYMFLAIMCYSCGQEKEAKEIVNQFMLCANDSVDKCENLYPGFNALNVKVKCDSFNIVSYSEQTDTLVVTGVAAVKSENKTIRKDSITFYLQNDAYDKLRIIGSNGLTNFSKDKGLILFALKTGANREGDWDADQLANLRTVQELYQRLLEDISKKVKLEEVYENGYGQTRLSKNRRMVISTIKVINNAGFEIPSAVVKSKFYHQDGYSSSPLRWYAYGSTLLENIPQGESTQSIQGKLRPSGALGLEFISGGPGTFCEVETMSIKLTDESMKRFIETHKFSGREYEEFIKQKMIE